MSRWVMALEWTKPEGSIKVSDKGSDAVAYLYANAKGDPCAAIFVARTAKPTMQQRYASEARREATIRNIFTACRALATRTKAKPKRRRARIVRRTPDTTNENNAGEAK